MGSERAKVVHCDESEALYIARSWIKQHQGPYTTGCLRSVNYSIRTGGGVAVPLHLHNMASPKCSMYLLELPDQPAMLVEYNDLTITRAVDKMLLPSRVVLRPLQLPVLWQNILLNCGRCLQRSCKKHQINFLNAVFNGFLLEN